MRIKSLIIFFLILSCEYHYGQSIQLKWDRVLPSSNPIIEFSQPFQLGDKLVFNQGESNSFIKPYTNLIRVINTSDGNIENVLLWPDHLPQQAKIDLLKINDREFYFAMDYTNRGIPMSFGKMDVSGQILWQDSVFSAARLNGAVLDKSLILDLSDRNGINKLVKINEAGELEWSYEDGEYDAWNHTVSNLQDRILWLNNSGLSLLNEKGQLVSKDSINRYLKSYSQFQLTEDKVNILTWGSYFKAKRARNNLTECIEDTLQIQHNFFTIPNSTITTDNTGNTYMAADYDYDGSSFVIKYDEQFNRVWISEFENQVVNIYSDSNMLIVIKDTSILLINPDNGSPIYELGFETNERIWNRAGKEDFYDSETNSIYLFTKRDSSVILKKFVIDLITSSSEEVPAYLKIYPNPVQNNLYFDYRHSSKIKIKIYSIDGLLIDERSVFDNSYDMTGLSSGIYFVHFISEGKRLVQKVVKL